VRNSERTEQRDERSNKRNRQEQRGRKPRRAVRGKVKDPCLTGRGAEPKRQRRRRQAADPTTAPQQARVDDLSQNGYGTTV
jgi:hypothetical protein